MTDKKDYQLYVNRWLEVRDVERQELLASSMEDRWRQFIAIMDLATNLGILQPDRSEEEVYQIWAAIKDKAEI